MHLIRRATAVWAAAGRRPQTLSPASSSVGRQRAAGVAAAALPRPLRRGFASGAEGVPGEPGVAPPETKQPSGGPASSGEEGVAEDVLAGDVAPEAKPSSSALLGAGAEEGVPAEPGMVPETGTVLHEKKKTPFRRQRKKSLIKRVKTGPRVSPPPGPPLVPGQQPPRRKQSLRRLRYIDNVSVLQYVLGEGQRALDAPPDPEADAPAASAATLQGRLAAAAYDAAAATVRLEYEGLAAPVHATTLWLRDRCACPRCVTASSGQKQFQTSALPAFPAIRSVDVVPVEGDDAAAGLETALRIVWAEEEGAQEAPHETTFPGQALLLALAKLDAPGIPALPPRRLWDRALLEQVLQPVAYDAWMADGPAFDRALLDLYQLGLVIVEGVPETVETTTATPQPGVRAVAERIGNIQNTFYGETFDVVSKPAAENVAYTSEFLCLHQDLLYMNDPPYIQLLHCLRNDSAGGESLFSDSLTAAVQLQLHHPAHLDVLATTPVRYHYERNGHYYFGARPLLELADAAGDGLDPAVAAGRGASAVIKHTAWSPPFQQAFAGYPVRPVRRAEAAEAAEAADAADTTTPDKRRHTRLHHWRAGAAVFQQLIEHSDNLFEMRLRPGQCVLFNNRRVLHGRRQFAPTTGARHLQGTYLDEQTFTSRVIGLVRDGRVPAAAWGADGRGGTTRQRPMPPMAREVVAAEQAQVAALLAARAAQATQEPQADNGEQKHASLHRAEPETE